MACSWSSAKKSECSESEDRANDRFSKMNSNSDALETFGQTHGGVGRPAECFVASTNFGLRALSRKVFHYNPRHRGRARMLAALLCTVAFGEVFVGDEAATPQFFKVR